MPKKEDVVAKVKEGYWYRKPTAKGTVDGVPFSVQLSRTRMLLQPYEITACSNIGRKNQHCESVYHMSRYSAKKHYEELIKKYNLKKLPSKRRYSGWI